EQTPIPQGGYPAKGIAICHNACPAAVKLRSKAFLAGEEPSLPLPNCDRPCHCSYRHLKDRRSDDDRRNPSEDIEPLQGVLAKEDVRKSKERRKKTPPNKGIY
ncbi:MAG: hypothetical protein ACR2QG_05430, partial [Gammaproteobacteria bacterium]